MVIGTPPNESGESIREERRRATARRPGVSDVAPAGRRRMRRTAGGRLSLLEATTDSSFGASSFGGRS
jgi:hypothetical protein